MKSSFTPNGIKLLSVCLLACATWQLARAADPGPADENPQQQQQRRGGGGRRGGPERGVYKAAIAPHWFQNNTRFWYRNDLRGGAKEFIVVDAEKGKRQPAFNHDRLAASLSKAAGEEYKSDHLPFSDIEFVDDGKAVRFE